MNIQKVVSSSGIEAWLVEEHRIPLITMDFGFVGGTSQDPDGKDGLAHFVSGLLDEGAGDLDAQAFQQKLEELAIRMNFQAGLDVFTGTLQTLTKNKDTAFDLLRLALTQPRMDADAVERVRAQILTGIEFDLKDPNKVASRKWFKLAFGNHPYGRPTRGTLASVRALSREDLLGFVRRNFARDNLRIAVVGDIDAKTLKAMLDKVFGALPAKADLTPVPEAELTAGPIKDVESMPIPQSVAEFGQPGLKRKDKDFIAAYVLNYIIGGGGFSSQLMEEVREKRGLAYSVYCYLYPLRHAGLIIGGVATKNASMAESLQVIRDVLTRIAEHGPTAAELDNAKRYLTGSYALRFDTSTKIADQLLWAQLEELGMDYFDKRNSLIEAVTLDDLRRVARRLIHPDAMVVAVVGQPDGLGAHTAATSDKATGSPSAAKADAALAPATSDSVKADTP